MKTLLPFIIAIFGCISDNPIVPFPKPAAILTKPFDSYENVFPIATLDLSNKGITDKIHVIYIAFDPLMHAENAFPGKDNIDQFTFHIENDGTYKPLFDKSALYLSNDFRELFREYKAQYRKAKSKANVDQFLRITGEPGWWQSDATPKNEDGSSWKFICQVDMFDEASGDRLVNDDCRLFVFYEPNKKLVKHIFQRD